MPQSSFISWEEFADNFLRYEEDDRINEETITWLEDLSKHPWQINRVSRDDLLSLPFLSASQTDSILSYREKKHGFLALGELQFVRGVDYYTRTYLSLFVRADSAVLPTKEDEMRLRKSLRIAPKLYKGRHEIETTIDVPFYRRKGYENADSAPSASAYTGNALRHIVRYRYTFGKEVAYAFTMEKDAGEPVAKQGFYPYDYLSGFVLLRPKGKRWAVVMGDFNVAGEEGLVFGRQTYGGREVFLTSGKLPETKFRGHTSSNESDFFRGAAFAYTFGRWQTMFLGSYRHLDGRLSETGDTVLSVLETGYHRSVAEIERRRNIGNLTLGYHLSFRPGRFRFALSGNITHYDKPIYSQWRYYNNDYFRGQTAATHSLSYAYMSRSFNISGETAFDHQWATATVLTANLKCAQNLRLRIQGRMLSPRFVSSFGEVVGQSSRTANEQGLLFAMRWLPKDTWEITAYTDAFRFPHATYTAALPGSKGIESSIRSVWTFRGRWKWLVQYKVKAKQQTVSGYELLEYRTKQRVRTSLTFTNPHYNLSLQGDLTSAIRQTGLHTMGWMCSARSTWKPSEKVSVKLFSSIFYTDGYDSAVYAYEPQLYRSFSFPSFYYHGWRGVGVASYRPLHSLTFSLRIGTTCYFNRDTISSGMQLINSSSKTDASLQVRWII